MTEPNVPGPEPGAASPCPAARPPSPGGDLRWQAFFRRSADPMFVLDRRRRVLFVNAAWEALAGTTAEEAYALVCRRPRPAGPGDSLQAILEHALTPPREVLDGRTARVRRLLPGREAPRVWDVDFFPLRMAGRASGVLVLGRITPVAPAETVSVAPLPEGLIALRERMSQRYGPELLSGAAPTIRLLAEQARLAEWTPVPVLLVGERGTGKQTLARLIHYRGPARERAFAAVDCERLPPAAVADILFGPSRVVLGSVYLREPSRLPRELQMRLCEVLRGASDASSGATAPRVLAGCGADPRSEVRAGRLLEELHAALAVLTLTLPSLRERAAELPALVDLLLERCNEEGGSRVTGLVPDAWEVLRAHAWPGNLRELHAVLAAARRRAKTERITAADLPASLRLLRRMDETPGRRPERPLPLDELLEQAERRLIEMALRRAKGKMARAAEILAVWRPRLLRRMKALGIGGAEAEDAGEE